MLSRLAVGKTILFDVTGHGLGHLSISGPVINEFIKLFPNVRVVVRSSLPWQTIRLFVSGDFEYHGRTGEVTLVAPSALDVNVNRSVLAYEVLFKRWDDELRLQTVFLHAVKPDLVVSNIDYLVLAAAQEVGIPSVGLCCMNWADMFQSFCTAAPHFREIERLLRQAYVGTNLFLQPNPHMSMIDIGTRLSIGPIARVGRNRADAVRAQAGCSDDGVMVLHSLGGWSGQSCADIPRIEGVQWLVTGDDTGGRSDIYSCRALAWPFADVVASVDTVVGKDSYGTVVEAACAGARLVISPRGNWPEEQCLSDWARANCCFVAADRSMRDKASLKRAVEHVLTLDRRPALAATGIREAVNAIATVGSL